MFGRDLERTCVCKQFTILIFGQGVLTVRHTANWGRVRALRLMNLVLLNIHLKDTYRHFQLSFKVHWMMLDAVLNKRA